MGILCGKVRYSIIGTIVFLVLYLFTTLYLGNVTGTAYTMFTAWLSLVIKVYPCGMLAGIAESTTRVNEFLSAMNKAHVPKKVVIPLAVMLRYLPTITRCISVSERAYLPSWHDHIRTLEYCKARALEAAISICAFRKIWRLTLSTLI